MDIGISEAPQRELFRPVPEVRPSLFRIEEEITLRPGDVLQVSWDRTAAVVPFEGPAVAISLVRSPKIPDVKWELQEGQNPTLIPQDIADAANKIALNTKGDKRPHAVRHIEIGWVVSMIQANQGITTDELMTLPTVRVLDRDRRRCLVSILRRHSKGLGLQIMEDGNRMQGNWKWYFSCIPGSTRNV